MLKMKLVFVLSLIVVYSCSQEVAVSYVINNDKKVQFIDELGGKGYVLTPKNYLYFVTEKPDPKTGEWLKYLVYRSEEPKKVSQVDLSDGFYNDTLLFYTSNKTEKQIVLWKQEYELYSYLHFYLFEDGQLVELGDIAVGQSCNGCDSFNFPVKDISVTSYHSEIKIEFNGKSVYVGSEIIDTPYHSKNIETEKLKLVYDGEKTSIAF